MAKKDRQVVSTTAEQHDLPVVEPSNTPVLEVALLDAKAILPTVAHPGEDLAFDLYSLETVMLYENQVTRVRTGVAVQMKRTDAEGYWGFLIRDRSSMALKGLMVSGGVIDSGYRGECFVNIALVGARGQYIIKAGDKIAQLIPMLPNTSGGVQRVESLSNDVNRGEKGYGSSGR